MVSWCQCRQHPTGDSPDKFMVQSWGGRGGNCKHQLPSHDRLSQVLILQEVRGTERRSSVEKEVTLKLHPAQRRWVLIVSIQLTDPFKEESVFLQCKVLISSSLCPLTVFVGSQFDCAPQKVFPVCSLDHCRRHLLLFPSQGAADWFIWHLQWQKHLLAWRNLRVCTVQPGRWIHTVYIYIHTHTEAVNWIYNLKHQTSFQICPPQFEFNFSKFHFDKNKPLRGCWP